MTHGYRRLWLLVEGNDDERFANAILVPEFERTYAEVQVRQYSQRSISDRANLLRSIHAMGEDYILLCDLDELPCVTSKKESMKKSMKSALPLPIPDDRIAVVVKEIESWYLAGLDEEGCQALDIDRVNRPDEVVKEEFDALVGGKINHTDTMIEILKLYKLSVALRRSPSFGYFARKHLANPRAT